MTYPEFLARIDYIFRPLLTSLSPNFSVAFYSKAKRYFLTKYVTQNVNSEIKNKLTEFTNTNDELFKPKLLWGIKFNSPIFNSAGMFKYGFGYEVVANQGSGAFLLGTTTSKKREGNTKNGIKHPFASYPKSHIASNWMGLPNFGHKDLADKIAKINKIDGCPIGVSMSADPEDNTKDKLNGLLDGLKLFDNSQVDFIEINESCPNVVGHSSNANPLDDELIERLNFISINFLQKRKRNLPVILKFSNDTEPDLIPELVKMLINLGYNGINIGNTSTKYVEFEKVIHANEKAVFNYFSKTFGGGLSGRKLKENSFKLSLIAQDTLDSIKKSKDIQEFHIIRTGGIENYNDIKISIEKGISLCQWYTGYFSKYALFGNKIYLKMITNKI
jgi:dihydroorotate dehydrogenase